jgi:hypothetical protein
MARPASRLAIVPPPPSARRARPSLDARGLRRAQRRFTEIFPGRFHDPTYVEWERDYKCAAHRLWHQLLGREEFETLLRRRAYTEVGRRALAVYSRPKLNLLALYEAIALREAVVDPAGARRFAPALYELIYGPPPFGPRFAAFVDTLATLPQRQSGVAKWPVATLYPFLAHPGEHLIVKPNLMKRAADSLGADLRYAPRPNAVTYAAILELARAVRRGLAAWRPRDMVDVQGFFWVTNSDEYAGWPWE